MKSRDSGESDKSDSTHLDPPKTAKSGNRVATSEKFHKKEGRRRNAPRYTAGELVWFLKSMRIMRFVRVNDGGKSCTLERLEDGRHLVAMFPAGIEPSNFF